MDEDIVFRILHCAGCDGPLLSAMLPGKHVMFYINSDGEQRYYCNLYKTHPFKESVDWLESWCCEEKHPEVVIDFTVTKNKILTPICTVHEYSSYLARLKAFRENMS